MDSVMTTLVDEEHTLESYMQSVRETMGETTNEGKNFTKPPCPWVMKYGENFRSLSGVAASLENREVVVYVDTNRVYSVDSSPGPSVRVPDVLYVSGTFYDSTPDLTIILRNPTFTTIFGHQFMIPTLYQIPPENIQAVVVPDDISVSSQMVKYQRELEQRNSSRGKGGSRSTVVRKGNRRIAADAPSFGFG